MIIKSANIGHRCILSIYNVCEIYFHFINNLVLTRETKEERPQNYLAEYFSRHLEKLLSFESRRAILEMTKCVIYCKNIRLWHQDGE